MNLVPVKNCRVAIPGSPHLFLGLAQTAQSVVAMAGQVYLTFVLTQRGTIEKQAFVSSGSGPGWSPLPREMVISEVDFRAGFVTHAVPSENWTSPRVTSQHSLSKPR